MTRNAYGCVYIFTLAILLLLYRTTTPPLLPNPTHPPHPPARHSHHPHPHTRPAATCTVRKQTNMALGAGTPTNNANYLFISNVDDDGNCATTASTTASTVRRRSFAPVFVVVVVVAGVVAKPFRGRAYILVYLNSIARE